MSKEDQTLSIEPLLKIKSNKGMLLESMVRLGRMKITQRILFMFLRDTGDRLLKMMITTVMNILEMNLKRKN